MRQKPGFEKSASQSFSLPLPMLERLDRVAYKFRIPKSTIIRTALERELPRYDDGQKDESGIIVPEGSSLREPAAKDV